MTCISPTIQFNVATQGISKLTLLEKACEICLTRQKSRNYLKSHETHILVGVLDVIHFNIYGPFEVPSQGGNKYYITFVDEFNKNIQLLLIKAKRKDFGMFNKFRVLTEKQYDRTLKILKTDDGGEYISK